MTTGADLVTALRRRAADLGVPLKRLIAPLTAHPTTWIGQLERAEHPKQHTIERVHALITGKRVPPPPPNNFQKSPARSPVNVVRHTADPENHPAPIDRDPCFKCGTRADLGCRHRAPQ